MNVIFQVVGTIVALFLVSKTDTKLGKLSGNILNIADTAIDAINNCIESVNLTIVDETKKTNTTKK